MGKVTAEEVKAKLAEKLGAGSTVDAGKGTDTVSVEKKELYGYELQGINAERPPSYTPEPTTASALGAEGASAPEPVLPTATPCELTSGAVESFVPSEAHTSTGTTTEPDDHLRFEEFAARCMHFGAYMVNLAHGERPYGPTPTEAEMATVLDAVEYLKENPRADARDLHIRWMAIMRMNGWTWGRVKDPVARKHPMLVEFEHLSIKDKAIDQAMVDGFLFAVYLRNTL